MEPALPPTLNDKPSATQQPVRRPACCRNIAAHHSRHLSVSRVHRAVAQTCTKAACRRARQRAPAATRLHRRGGTVDRGPTQFAPTPTPTLKKSTPAGAARTPAVPPRAHPHKPPGPHGPAKRRLGWHSRKRVQPRRPGAPPHTSTTATAATLQLRRHARAAPRPRSAQQRATLGPPLSPPPTQPLPPTPTSAAAGGILLKERDGEGSESERSNGRGKPKVRPLPPVPDPKAPPPSIPIVLQPNRLGEPGLPLSSQHDHHHPRQPQQQEGHQQEAMLLLVPRGRWADRGPDGDSDMMPPPYTSPAYGTRSR